MSEILHTDEDGRFQAVRLSSEHTSYNTRELSARLFQTVVHITRLDADHKPKQFNLSAPEMDALTDAWIAFKAEQAARETAEKARQHEVLAEAIRLASEMKTDFDGLKIVIKRKHDEYYGDTYLVQIPALGRNSERISWPDRLLAEVKEALTYIEEHIVWLENCTLAEPTEGESESTTRNRKMIAAYRAVKPRPAAEPETTTNEPEPEEVPF